MFGLKKILLPVDFSARSAAVAPYAKALAAKFQSQLLLFHVEDNPRLIGAVGIPRRRSATVEQTGQVKAQLESLLTSEFQGFPVTRILVEGDPAGKIVECAHSEKVDLIVMPTRGYGPYRRFLLGSVTAKVLHDSDCPVWTSVHLQEAHQTESSALNKIACAVDLGAHSEKVLCWASGIASAFGARLLVVHAAPLSDAFVAEASAPEARVASINRGKEDIQGLLSKLNIQAEVAVNSGSVSEVVYNQAARFAADLLIIGRHAAKGVAGRLHPHAYSIIRESLCPVVSI